MTARLDAAETDLNALADQVEALGTTARSALSSLNGADAAAGEADIEQGDQLVSGIVARTRLLREALAEVPYVGTPAAGLSVSDAVVARHAALVAALDATDGLDADWNRLTIGAVAASNMSRHPGRARSAGRCRGGPRRSGEVRRRDQGPRPGEGADHRGPGAPRQPERHGRRHGPRRVADPQRELRRRPREPLQGDLEGRFEGHQGDARGGDRGGRGARPAATGHARPGR